MLNVDSVNDDDNFFEVGGDSIKGAQLVGWLIQKGLKLDMLKIYTAPTIEELVEALEETQPMAVPKELLTKDNVERFMKDPVVQKAMAGGRPGPLPGPGPRMGAGQPQRLCTPPMGAGQPQQLCTPQMGAGYPQQLCTTPMGAGHPQQLCTPPMGVMPQMPAMPPMGYMQPMVYMMPMAYMMPMVYMMPMAVMQPMAPMAQMPPMPPIQPGQQLCSPPMGAGQPGMGGLQAPYMGFPTDGPIQDPNVINIQEPKLGPVTRAPEDALNFVLSGIFPNGYDKQENLLSQGMTSFQMMQLITRIGEQGYRLKIEDVIKNPTFSGIVGSMKTE